MTKATQLKLLTEGVNVRELLLDTPVVFEIKIIV